MQITPPIRINKSLSSSELIILKSIALGLGCNTIRDLLEISEETYDQYCSNLFEKLEVCNMYAAVQKAYYLKILMNKEYTSEKVKCSALMYAHEFQERFKSIKLDSKQTVWELYDMLLEFHNQVESSSIKDKKTGVKNRRSNDT
jgi:DNA-binding CsgD family transcriptional regulator